MPRVPFPRPYSLEVHRDGDRLRFALHNGSRFVPPAFRIGPDYYRIISRKPATFAGELKRPVEIEMCDLCGNLAVESDGTQCCFIAWLDWINACWKA